MRCVMPIMSYAKMDSQCDKLVMVVGRTMLTTLEMIDVQWQKVGKIGFISEFCRSFVSGPCARLSWPSRQVLSAC